MFQYSGERARFGFDRSLYTRTYLANASVWIVILSALVGCWYFHRNPPSRIVVRIGGLPSDARFACVEAEINGKRWYVDWSVGQKGPIGGPDDESPFNSTLSVPRRGDRESTLEHYVRWPKADRHGVLFQDGVGKWWIVWFRPEEIVSRGRLWILGGGEVLLDVSGKQVMSLQ